ncbi:MAG: hypothetical protein QOD57_561, partial [Actinomycetota bacterium]|nr:hypothetical protein [Actinomycetota bacterium]
APAMKAVEDGPAGPVLLAGVVATGAGNGAAAGSAGGAAAGGGGGGEARTTGKGMAVGGGCPVADRAAVGDVVADNGAGLRRTAEPGVPAVVVDGPVAGPVVPGVAAEGVVDRPRCWCPPPGAAPPVPAGGLADEPGDWPRCDPWCDPTGVPVEVGVGPGAGLVAGVVVVVPAGAVVVDDAGAVVVVDDAAAVVVVVARAEVVVVGVVPRVVVVVGAVVVVDDALEASTGSVATPKPVIVVAATTSGNSAEWTRRRCVGMSSSFPRRGFAAVAPSAATSDGEGTSPDVPEAAGSGRCFRGRPYGRPDEAAVRSKEQEADRSGDTSGHLYLDSAKATSCRMKRR